MRNIGRGDRPTEQRWILLALLAYLGVMLAVSLLSAGTGDSGDSIMHFQIARYAFRHPENFLSHWGKPVFTLVAAPFAQLGFGGMKLLQCLLAFGIGWLAWGCAKRLQLETAWAAPFLALAAPALIVAQLSGLTEPLFAFNLVLGAYLLLSDRAEWGALALSWLPFVRTEGFFLLPVFALYLLVARRWRALPLLAAGTALYMALGGIFKGDLLWIWTENPYANKPANYGSGDWGHFFEQYTYVAGLPIYALTVLGLLGMALGIARRGLQRQAQWLLVVVGPFAVYFGMHSYLWATGTGHSMGLNRVLIAILPLGALMAALGLQTLRRRVPLHWARPVVGVLAMAYVLAFPFIPNPAALKARDFQRTEDQKLLQEAVEWMQAGEWGDRKLYSAHPSAAWLAGVDPFDPQRYRSLNRLKDDVPVPGMLVLYDGWFGKIESGYALTHFTESPAEWRTLKVWHGQAGDTPLVMALLERL